MPVQGIPQRVLTQVCIIVRDLDASVARYDRILGFSAPDMQITLRHDQTDATYHGAPTDARARIAIYRIGQLEFELMEPLEPPSAWKDYLDRYGEGIHHVALFVPNTDAAVASFAEYGYQVTQRGLFTGKTGSYTYLDTDKDLGVVIELLEHFGGSPTLNAPPFDPARGLGTDVITQVGIMTHDIHKMAARWVEVFGVPAPDIFTTPGYDEVKTTYHGAPTDAKAQLAFFNFGQVTIELIQPDDQPSVWRDFLDQHGDGAHHIALQVRNTKQATDMLAGFDIPVAMQGLYGDKSGVYTYMDSAPALGAMIELLENFPRS